MDDLTLLSDVYSIGDELLVKCVTEQETSIDVENRDVERII